jgi:ABC-2 type transport system ATP-binding protein
MITLEDVTVRLAGSHGQREVTIVSGLSVALSSGVALLRGPNGAGKTTLLRVLAGIIRPDSGKVFWRGCSIQESGPRYRRRLGYLPQRQAVYPEMPVGAFLSYVAALKAIPPNLAAARQRELLRDLALEGEDATPLGRLSQGNRRRVGLAQALLNDPEVLLLDEPFEGLDHDGRRRAGRLLHRPGRVTVIASHLTEQPVPGLTSVWEIAHGEVHPWPSRFGI